jgi:hypothetical protein
LFHGRVFGVQSGDLENRQTWQPGTSGAQRIPATPPSEAGRDSRLAFSMNTCRPDAGTGWVADDDRDFG